MAYSSTRQKFLEIGNYPPPVCGWAMQTKLLSEELRRRGHICQVLNINENRKKKSPEYVDVQNGLDYAYKILRFALAGYRFHVHVNAESKKGYLLALAAAALTRLWGRPAALSFHGGLPQTYFPRDDSRRLRAAFQLLFRLPGVIFCNNAEVREAILGYGIDPRHVCAIPAFSAEHLQFSPVQLSPEMEDFLAAHQPAFFCYVSFRPEYRLAVLREAMKSFCRNYPDAGFIWLGFPLKEMPAAREYVDGWPEDERRSLLMLGNVEHDQFLTLMTRCTACIRTPACDGVSASVLEALALGVPVVASENRRRPSSALTYPEYDVEALCQQLGYVTENRSRVVENIPPLESLERNVNRTADVLAGEQTPELAEVARA